MANFENQKAEKLTIMDVARKQLSGDILDEFEMFLGFLKDEKINPVWKSINGFSAKYKGEGVCSITLGAPGWFDNAIERKNYIGVGVETVGWGKIGFDEYLEGQDDEIIRLFMEQISNKCVHCRPTCGCSKVSGRTIEVAGRQHENVCMNATGYKFYASGDNMREFIMCSPCAVYPPIEVRPVPIETVKKLIMARKAYITK